MGVLGVGVEGREVEEVLTGVEGVAGVEGEEGTGASVPPKGSCAFGVNGSSPICAPPPPPSPPPPAAAFTSTPDMAKWVLVISSKVILEVAFLKMERVERVW